MPVSPELAEKIRSLIAQRSRLTTNSVFDPSDPQVKARIDQIDNELRKLGGEGVLQIAQPRRSM